MQISSNQSLSNLSTIESHTSRPKPKNKFSPEEDELLLSLANEYNEKNWKVQMGYSAQKAGLLKPYYTIVKCKYKI